MKEFIRKVLQTAYDAASSGSYNQRLLEENVWHHVLHESFRSNHWKTGLSLSIGRWAGGASFFYILHRVLEDIQPEKVVELGLGESSKLISSYASHEEWLKSHFIIEHSESWIAAFQKRFQLSEKSDIILHSLVGKTQNFGPKDGLRYRGVDKHVWQDATLVVIDGPFGSDSYSRMNVMDFVNQLLPESTFVLILDDSHRRGEKETLSEIRNLLFANKITFHEKEYGGLKSCTLICSHHYPWLASL